MYSLNYKDKDQVVTFNPDVTNISIVPFGTTILNLGMVFDEDSLSKLYTITADIKGVHRNKYKVKINITNQQYSEGWSSCTNTTNMIPTSLDEKWYMHIKIQSECKVEHKVSLNINTIINPLSTKEGIMWSYTGGTGNV